MTGLNEKGHVVGYAGPVGGEHPFLFDGTRIVDLGMGPGQRTLAYAVNVNDVAVGLSGTAVLSYSVRFSDGKVEVLPVAAGRDGAAGDINDQGDITGYFDGPDGSDHPYLIRNGAFIDLGQPSGLYNSRGTALNGSDTVVGVSYTPSNASRAFSWANGIFTLIPPQSGANGNEAVDVNATGQVAVVEYVLGTLGQPDRVRSYIYTTGQYTDIGSLPGATFTFIRSINDKGEAVGISDAKPFLYRNGTMVDLNSLLPAGSGWVLQDPVAINNAGQVLGIGGFNNKTRTYLFTLPR